MPRAGVVAAGVVSAGVDAYRGRPVHRPFDQADRADHQGSSAAQDGLRQLNDAFDSLSPLPERCPSPASSLSSSAFSVPSYEELRWTYLLAGIPSPLFLLAAFGAIAVWAWPPRPRPIYWQELLLGALTHLAAEAVRAPLATLVPPPPTFARQSYLGLLPIFLAAYVHELFRLFAISLSVNLEVIAVQSDLSSAFFRAVWLGIGGATAESALRTADLLRQVGLYQDLLEHDVGRVVLEDDIETARPRMDIDEEIYADSPAELPQQHLAHARGQLRAEAAEAAETADMIDAHLRARERLAIIDSYGVELTRIPGFLVVLWSLNAILLSTGLSTLLYLGFMHPTPVHAIDPALVPTWLAVGGLHGLLSASWVILLPSVGLAPVSFASFLVLILLNLLALACWGTIR